MADADALFKNRKVRFDRLLPFGFSDCEQGYRYATALVNNQFEMTVTVTKEGAISTDVIDVLSAEPYVLHRVPGAVGAFVGAVRAEYQDVLAAIVTACFESDVFQSPQAKQIIQYVRETYHDDLQFLWERFSGNAVYRRQDNAKWYAVLLIVPGRKIGRETDDPVDILDLRGIPEDICVLIDGKRYFPGYHMNKKHWFTICLDGSLPTEEILPRIDQSFALAARR